jgi:hypothetical protein
LDVDFVSNETRGMHSVLHYGASAELVTCKNTDGQEANEKD